MSIPRRRFTTATALAITTKTHATIVGEPICERPKNSFGEVKSFRLPYSGLAISYSTKIFSPSPDDPDGFYPDVNVPPTPESIVSGRDPAMEWILSRR